MTIITVLGNNSFLIFVKKRGSDVEGEAPQGPHLLAGPKDSHVTIIIITHALSLSIVVSRVSNFRPPIKRAYSDHVIVKRKITLFPNKYQSCYDEKLIFGLFVKKIDKKNQARRAAKRPPAGKPKLSRATLFHPTSRLYKYSSVLL